MREVASIKTGPFGSLLHAEDYVVDGIPIVTTEHFKSGFLPDEKAGLPQVSESDRARLEQYSAIEGDILFSRVGSVDVNAQVTTAQSGWLFSGRVLRARPTVSVISPNYLHYELSTDDVKRSIINRAVGGTMASINTEILEDTEISFPRSRTEQLEIGRSLGNLDSLITLHQRKCQYRGLYEYLSWEQRKLGEFGSVAMCKRIYKEQTSEQGDVPFFKIGTFGADPDAFISNELFDYFKRTYPYPTPGTLLISAAGSIGRVVEYQGEKAYFQDSNIVWLEHDHRLNDTFLKPLYSQIEWGLEGSTIKRLYNKDLLSAEVTIPGSGEQKEIGRFFAKLDDLITLHQREPRFADTG